MNTVTTIEWPAVLPLPLRAFSSSPVVATALSDVGYVKHNRRRRFTHTYHQMKVDWDFTASQYTIFYSFYVISLAKGATAFKLDLRFPRQSVLTSWQVKFVSPLQATYADARWKVSATICLLHPTVLVDPRPPIGIDTGLDTFVPDTDDLYFDIGTSYECSSGTAAIATSDYVWSLEGGGSANPNSQISQDYISKYLALFHAERDIAWAGLDVIAQSDVYWWFYPISGTRLSALNKVAGGNLDPTSEEGDWEILVNGYWVFEQVGCYA